MAQQTVVLSAGSSTGSIASSQPLGATEGEREEDWLVCSSLGRDAPRICEMCLTKEGRQLKLMPWGGAAARLGVRLPGIPSGEEEVAAMQPTDTAPWASLRGQAFCFLPLPAETGLPVHANGYFELSANRRDIWYGTDMMGAGKLRSDWNCALLEDVVAPSYAQLLLNARTQTPSVAQYYELWPHFRMAEPWGLLVDTLYRSLLVQPCLYTEADGGRWVSPEEAVFIDGDAGADALLAPLLRGGMPLVRVPKAISERLHIAARACGVTLRTADPPTVRSWLLAGEGRQDGLSRDEGVELLRHCVSDTGFPAFDWSDLRGLQLVPLVSGGFGWIDVVDPSRLFNEKVVLRGLAAKAELNGSRGTVVEYDKEISRYTVELAQAVQPDGFAAADRVKVLIEKMDVLSGRSTCVAPPLVLIPSNDRELLARRPDLLIDLEPDEPLGRTLSRIGSFGTTNLQVFSAAALPKVLPMLLPASWRGCEVATIDDSGPSLEWLLSLWDYLGREHAQVALSSLTGWPLLPAASGVAYALPATGAHGSRMLELSGSSDDLVSCLRGAGCLQLHDGVSRAHPQLFEYVHRVSACAVLRAIEVSAAAAEALLRDIGGAPPSRSVSESTVAPLFESVSLVERRSLRLMLSERRHVEERDLVGDEALMIVLRALPVYEVHSSASADDASAEAEAAADGSDCVPLRLEEHRLAPANVPTGMLDGRFVKCVVNGEEGLIAFAGIPQLVRSRYYREHVFPRVAELGSSKRDGAMLSALHELHALSNEDGGFISALRELAFVPVGSGSLHRACDLFHPRVSEAAELLDGAEVFPSGAYAEVDVLSVLERLGMRNTITRSAVLQSAKSVEALMNAKEPEAAKRRGKSLLRYINEESWVTDVQVFAAQGSASTAAPPASERPGVPDEFVTELSRIAWMPIVASPPHPSLPWCGQQQGSVAPPQEVRPAKEMWLVSHCLGVLDGELTSEILLKAFEWDQPPRPGVVCAQLVQFAEQYDPSVAPEDAFLWEKLLLPTYAQLMGLIDSPSFTAVVAMLQSRKCLWIGREHGFLSPEHLIFDPEKSFTATSPYLSRVTSALEAFEPLLRALNVRDAFEPLDYAHANACFVRDGSEKPLPPETLKLCVATLEAAYAATTSGAEGSDAASGLSGHSIFLPDANGVLRLASELTYDDAPWMSSTLRERPDGGGVQFVHESVSTKLAESLGARSLRYLLLLEEKLTDSLPCPGIEPIKRALSDGGARRSSFSICLRSPTLSARALSIL